jgi:hypothetical protein
LDSVSKDRKKSDSRRKRDKKKGKRSRDISSDEDELDKIKKGSRKKKWYSSDENSSFYTSESDSDRDDKKQRRRRGKKKKGDGSSDYSGERSKRKTKSRSGKKEYTSEEDSSSSDGSDGGKHQKSRRKDGSRENKIKGEGEATDIAANSTSEKDIARKEMGLDWMLRSESKRPAVSETKEILPEEVPVEEVRICLKFHFPSDVQMSSFTCQLLYVFSLSFCMNSLFILPISVCVIFMVFLTRYEKRYKKGK